MVENYRKTAVIKDLKRGFKRIAEKVVFNKNLILISSGVVSQVSYAEETNRLCVLVCDKGLDNDKKKLLSIIVDI